jgi:hypothetical protein
MVVSSTFYIVSIVWLSAFTIPISILYLIVIIALLYNRNTEPFASSFFTLWVNVGIFDLLMTCESWTFTNTWTLNGIWPSTVDNVVTFYFVYVS